MENFDKYEFPVITEKQYNPKKIYGNPTKNSLAELGSVVADHVIIPSTAMHLSGQRYLGNFGIRGFSPFGYNATRVGIT